MSIRIKDLNCTENKRYDITVIEDNRFFFFGEVQIYEVRIFIGRGRKKELSKKEALQLIEELFSYKDKWTKGKWKEGYTHKTVHTSIPHGNIYIKIQEKEQATDNGATNESE